MTKGALIIGRRVGLATSAYREGSLLPWDAVVGAVIAARAKHIGGEANVGLSAWAVDGRYKGGKEPTIKVEIVYTGDERRAEVFRSNMGKMAQDVARALGQREVITEWTVPGRPVRAGSASPTGAPPPYGPGWCDWVRRHSVMAQTDERDSCHITRSPAEVLAPPAPKPTRAQRRRSARAWMLEAPAGKPPGLFAFGRTRVR
jgi:hypothetical protein